MTTLPPEAVTAAAAAIRALGHIPAYDGQPPRRIAIAALEAAAPSMNALTEERTFAAARDELAKMLTDLGADAARQGMAAERERILAALERQAEKLQISDLPTAADALRDFAILLRNERL